VFGKQSNPAIIATLIFAVFLWGGSNAGTKFMVRSWPSAWVGSTRLLAAGFMLLGILRWTRWMGKLSVLSAAQKTNLWLRGGFSLGAYILIFNLALHKTSATHVALYLGAAPVWALLMEERPGFTKRAAQRYGAAGLALAGIVVLSWPALKSGETKVFGELLGITASILWAFYGRQCRALSAGLSGAEVSAHTMWRAGCLLVPMAVWELTTLDSAPQAGARPGFWHADLVLVQLYCCIAGGVVSYALWNNALRHWPTSRVFLFNNLIPISTMSWAHFCLGEPVTSTFWLAMVLVVSGVVLGQTSWEKIFGRRWVPAE
jgi:drug/metabolite transporter (DMT)-like permease